MQGDQISNTSIYSEQILISTNHNILEEFIQTFNYVILVYAEIFPSNFSKCFVPFSFVGLKSQSQLLAHPAR
jgi:hypothetical protein